MMRGQTYATIHNPNCPSPFQVRLPGKGHVLDCKFTSDESHDAIGYGITEEDAFSEALENKGITL